MKSKKGWSVLLSLFLTFAMILTGAVLNLNEKDITAVTANSAPVVEGNWLLDIYDDIAANESGYDLSQKDYNSGRSGSTPETALLIRTREDLIFISYLTYRGYANSAANRKYYRLDADIDLSGKNWQPIGRQNNDNYRFLGAFDGGGHKILNLSIVDASTQYQGLFGFVAQNAYADFRNITIENAYISGIGSNTNNYAFLCGYAYDATVENVTVKNSTITSVGQNASYYGLVGYANGSLNANNINITDTNIAGTSAYYGMIAGNVEGSLTANRININNSAIEGTNQYYGLIAGRVNGNLTINSSAADFSSLDGTIISENANHGLAVGYVNYGNILIQNVTTNGTINNSSAGNTYSAGLIGYAVVDSQSILIKNCINNADITSAGSYAAGIVGYINITNNANLHIELNNVVNNGDITGNAFIAGLIARTNYAKLIRCSNEGDLYSNQTSGQQAGGLIAQSVTGVDIDSSYNAGYIEGYSVGGLVGGVNGSGSAGAMYNCVIENSYNTGTIKSTERTGGLIGYYYTDTTTQNGAQTYTNLKLTITNCYNSGNLEPSRNSAGIIVLMRGNLLLDSVYNTTSISHSSNGEYTGGLVAFLNYGLLEIVNSYNEGDILTPFSNYVGGLVGQVEPQMNQIKNGGLKVENSYNLGNLEGRNVGGIAGFVRGYLNIDKSFNMGTLSPSGERVGGFVAYFCIELCNTYAVSGIYNSYNTGEIVAGATQDIAGFVGRLDFNSNGAASGAEPLDIINTTFQIVKCHNAGLIQYTNYTNAFIRRLIFSQVSEGFQKVEIASSFSVNNAFQEGENNLATTPVISYENANRIFLIDTEETETVVLDDQGNPIPLLDENGQPVMDGDEPVYQTITTTTGSRVLSAQELKTKKTYNDEEYDFENTWAMPAESGTGNNGAPYLKNLAAINVRMIIDQQTENFYTAVFNENLNIAPGLVGKTFLGWSTAQDDSGTFYAVGTPVILKNKNITLYAQFESTNYYKIIIDGASAGSVEAQLDATTLDGSGEFDLISLTENDDVYLLSLMRTEPNFFGWQVWKQKNAVTGEGHWVTLSTAEVLSLKDLIDQIFIEDYAMLSEATVEGEYFTNVGTLRFRASKTTISVGIGADANDALLGSLAINGNDAPYTQSTLFALTDSTETTLQATPKDFYKASQFIVQYYADGVKQGEEITLSAVNNFAKFVLSAEGMTGNISIIVKVIFEKINFDVLINVQTKDIADYDISGLELVSGTHAEQIRINEEAAFDLTAVNEQNFESYKLCFVGFKIFNYTTNSYDYILNENALKFVKNGVIDSDYLSAYSNDGQFVIIAEYMVKYRVSITNSIGGKIEIVMKEGDSTITTTYNNSITELYFEKGSIINITANADNYYAFSEFDGKTIGTIDQQNPNILNITLTDEVNVATVYNLLTYEIVVKLVDRDSQTQINDGEIQFAINSDLQATHAKINDDIEFINSIVPNGYRFDSFILKNADNNLVLSSGELEITKELLEIYLTSDNKLTVTGRFVKQYTLNVLIPDEQARMGNFVVKEFMGDQYVQTDKTVFDVGTKIEIEAAVNTHYIFKGFNVPTFENPEKDNTANITLIESNRTIILNFEPVVYTIVAENNVGAGTISISKQQFIVGNVVVIMFTPQQGQVIKSWKLNGVDVNKLPSNVVVKENSVAITITDEWYQEYGTELNSTIITGLNSGIMGAIIAVGTAVPTLLALLIVFYVLNSKKKKLIRAELKSNAMNKYKLDTSSFIKDLKEGKNAGVVTDADVKAEMKRRKKDKK